MPVENLQDYEPGALFTFDKVFKGHAAGTVAELKEVVNVSGLSMAMVALPDQPDVKPFSMHPKMFSPAEGTVAGGGDSIEGAVLDLFMQHANMEHQLALNFIGAYIAQTGDTDDVGTIGMLMDNNDFKIGEPWTMAQTAKLYGDFLELFDLDRDELIDTVIAEEDEKIKKAALKKNTAATAASNKPTTTTATTATKPSATVPAAEAKGRVDRESWTPTRIDAFRACGLLMPIYAESPDNFEAIIALAVRMVKQADTVRDTSK